jgi:hypothetical protein
MRIFFPALFCFLLGAANVSAQSPIASANGEAPVGVASGEAPAAGASGIVPAAASSSKTPVAVIRGNVPAAPARGKTIELGLGYSYVSHAENLSQRVGLQGADGSVTIYFGRVGLKADVGYARASNVFGTGKHSDVLSYLVGPVFHHRVRPNFNTYAHALVGGVRVSGPILTNGGLILLGGWSTGYAWAVGGGTEYWVTPSMAIRTGADYLRTTYYDASLVIRGQGNLRTTATVAYYFGMRPRKRM